jgi:Flp pilus assembly protein TadG
MPKGHSWLVFATLHLAREQGGNVLLSCAIAFPVLAFAVGVAVDFTSVEADRVAMQGAADSAALAGAAQLSVANQTAVAQRTQAVALAQLNRLLGSWTLSVNAQTLNSNTAVQVTISGNRPALFHDLFPSNGWNASATATAQAEAVMPLCALGITSFNNSAVVELENTAQLSAPNCLVQSNQNIMVTGGEITAGAVSAVGAATGNISPSPQTGAPAIPDPFAALNLTMPSGCTDSLSLLGLLVGSASWPPGVHCGTLSLLGPSTVTLQPGTHYFKGASLQLLGQTNFQGTNVTLIFDQASTLTVSGAGLNLTGATSGPFAGFVLIAARNNTGTFTIDTSNAHTLEGVVYIPGATLSIQGNSPVAEASNWTVIVANAITVNGSADLVLNANYDGSGVPVPVGAGPGGAAPAGVRLTN